MLVAWMLPGDDDQPATRRDVSSARESIEHKVRADIAEVRTEMVEGFRETDQKFGEVRTEIASVRTEMANGFREIDQEIGEVRTEIASVRTEMANGFREIDQEIGGARTEIADVRTEIAEVRTEMVALSTKQTRFLVGLMVVMNGTVLAAVLRTG